MDPSEMRRLVLSAVAGVAIVCAAVLLSRPGEPAVTLEPALVSSTLAALQHARDSAARIMPDPMFPDRSLRITGERDSSASGLSGLRPPPGGGRPLPHETPSRTAEERGGVDPCARPDPGYGIYTEWQYRSGFGRLLIPKEAPVDAEGRFDVMAQFHGADLARLEFVRGDAPFVFVAVHQGKGGSYPELSGSAALPAFIHSLEKTMSLESPIGEAHADHVALSSWSAGFGGIKRILQRSEGLDRLDAVVLLDSLHMARNERVGAARIAPFIKFAKRAVRGEAFMFVSYSSIMTDRFASTTESARLLISELGGNPLPVEGDGPAGMQLKEVYSQGNFHARGYLGGGKLDHCAHLLLLPEVTRVLDRRWHPAPRH
jgi:hypothetical protein